MCKFFVVSDVHGFYDELRDALDDAGFDPTNEKHYLISCGDNFDRGPQNLEVMKFFIRTPRTILIRGNHEDLFDWAIRDGFTMRDVQNGTYQTIQELGKCKVEPWASQDEIIEYVFRTTRGFFNRMVDFFETEHYVFTHGWIPSALKSPDREWRKARLQQWEKARWYNGMEKAMLGDLDPLGKTIVCGHWHTSWGHHRQDGTPEWGESANFDIYRAKGIIAIDACTAYSKKVNVLILEDEFMREID